MRRFLPLAALLSAGSLALALPSRAQSTGDLVVVANAHGSYCGGAAPTPDILAAARRPRPITGRFLVRRGRRNSVAAPVATLQTDATGTGTVALPPGTYCIVSESK